MVGFASGGPERTGRLGATGELYALYVLQAAQRMGLGRRLTEAALAELGKGVAVWVLEVNPARGFYERMGGRRLATRQSYFAGASFTEVAYLLG
jgi:ribosomal protein S18 acetylase RimI-like enzyme